MKRKWPAPGPGSNDHAARVLLEMAARLGLSRGKAQYLAGAGAFGEYPSILTYKQTAGTMVNARGEAYHPESTGRIARELTEAGLMLHRKLGPGKPTSRAMPDGRHWSFASGTTENYPNWDRLTELTGIRRPTFRGERVRQAHALERRRTFNVPPPGLVEHAQRTARDLRSAEKPGAERAASSTRRGAPMPPEIMEWVRGGMDGPPPQPRGPP